MKIEWGLIGFLDVSTHLFERICLSVCASIQLSIHMSIHIPHLSVYPYICPWVCWSKMIFFLFNKNDLKTIRIE